MIMASRMALCAALIGTTVHAQTATDQKPTELKVVRKSLPEGTETVVSTPFLSLTSRKNTDGKSFQVFTVTIRDDKVERLEQILFVAEEGVSLETARLDKKSQLVTETKYSPSGDFLCQRIHAPGREPPAWLDAQGREIPMTELSNILKQTCLDLRLRQ